jgi:riboflavin synthase
VFSGIVKGVGRILELAELEGDRRLTVDYRQVAMRPLAVGGSVAVNGVCLTAIDCSDGRFAADVSLETLSVTTLGALVNGARVNLEPALALGDPVDGHLVSGHVDGVGHVVAIDGAARSRRLTVDLPHGLAPYVARKGAVAVDGVSLTVNSIEGGRFTVNIVPHTFASTIIAEYRMGSAVNIEVDMAARYLERWVLERRS